MRIGLDIGPIRAGRTGVGTYTFHLLKHLLGMTPDDELAGFSSGVERPDLSDLTEAAALRTRHIPLPTRAVYKMWDYLRFPKVDTFLGGLDVFHGTNFFLPPTASAKRVVTVHDLAFLLMPEVCSPKIIAPFRKSVRRAARCADAIIACSESTKADVVNLLGVEPERVTVALEAVDDSFVACENRGARDVTARYGIRDPFILFVGTLEPRKNIPTLLRAFAQVASDIPHNLVLLGGVGWKAEEIFDTIDELGLGTRVIRPGYVESKDLPAFYTAADAFVFPSLYEGFGLPILEAMTCGCPVITSNNSSIPEVAGDAAIQHDAMDVDGFARSMRTVIEDYALRESMAAHGKAQAAAFSWETCARTTYGVYKGLVS